MKATADGRSRFHVPRMNSTITSHRAAITTSASQGFCNTKKTGDQRKFRNSCAHQRGSNDPRSRASYWRQPDMAMSRYRVVQTGAKIQFGGLKAGLDSSAYQAPGAVKVPINMPPPMTNVRKAMRMVHLVTDAHFLFCVSEVVSARKAQDPCFGLCVKCCGCLARGVYKRHSRTGNF